MFSTELLHDDSVSYNFINIADNFKNFAFHPHKFGGIKLFILIYSTSFHRISALFHPDCLFNEQLDVTLTGMCMATKNHFP
jgi:hypothetical protein